MSKIQTYIRQSIAQQEDFGSATIRQTSLDQILSALGVAGSVLGSLLPGYVGGSYQEPDYIMESIKDVRRYAWQVGNELQSPNWLKALDIQFNNLDRSRKRRLDSVVVSSGGASGGDPPWWLWKNLSKAEMNFSFNSSAHPTDHAVSFYRTSNVGRSHNKYDQKNSSEHLDIEKLVEGLGLLSVVLILVSGFKWARNFWEKRKIRKVIREAIKDLESKRQLLHRKLEQIPWVELHLWGGQVLSFC